MKFQSRAVGRQPYDETKQATRILRAARLVFVRDGWAAFSARRVAREAKASLGSVQHFFPTSDALLIAMLEYVVNDYELAYQRMFDALPFDGEQRLAGAIDFLLEDIWKPETRRFFFGFWALSCHNRLAGTLLNEAYAHHCRNFATFIGAARPHYGEARCREVAAHVVALIEGSMLFSGPRHKAGTPRAAMTRALRRSILALIAAHAEPGA